MQPDASPSSELFFGQPRIHHWKLPSQQESVNIILEKHQAKIKVLLGNEINCTDLIDLAGIPNGYEITIFAIWDGGLKVKIEANSRQSKNHVLERSIQILKSKQLVINDYQANQHPKKGSGLTIFAHQASKATQLGFQTINLKAARGTSMNGYYTWVRLGCNGVLRQALIKKVKRQFLQTYGFELPIELTTIHDLLGIEGGLQMWQIHGDTIEVFFDLKPQSQSWSILNDYIREKEFGFANGWIKPIE
jgi:hypothetical protein